MVRKLVLRPDRYDGKWIFGDERVSGSILLQGQRCPSGKLGEVPGTTLRHAEVGFPHDDEVDVLRGWLETNHEVVLLGVTLLHWFPGRTRMSADVALVGGEVPEDLLFTSIEFQVGGLTELAGVRPLKDVLMPHTLSEGAVFSATWGEHSVQRWITADGDELELNFTATVDYGDWYGMAVTSAPVVRVSGEARTAQDWIGQYVQPLAEISTLATQRRQSVSWLQVRPGKDEWPVQVFTADIDQEPYYATAPDPKLMISDTHPSLIQLGTNGAVLPDLLDRWRTLHTDHTTFHDYLTLSRRDPLISRRSRFLAAVPALEGLHAATHGEVPPGRDDQRRAEVIDRIRALPGVQAADLDYLDQRLAPPTSYQLAYRLRALVQDDLGDELDAMITRCTSPLPDFLALQDASGPQDIWEVMATARNRIAHGRNLVPAIEQVDALAKLAHTVATGMALVYLGVSDTALCAGIEHDRWSML